MMIKSRDYELDLDGSWSLHNGLSKDNTLGSRFYNVGQRLREPQESIWYDSITGSINQLEEALPELKKGIIK